METNTTEQLELTQLEKTDNQENDQELLSGMIEYDRRLRIKINNLKKKHSNLNSMFLSKSIDTTYYVNKIDTIHKDVSEIVDDFGRMMFLSQEYSNINLVIADICDHFKSALGFKSKLLREIECKEPKLPDKESE